MSARNGGLLVSAADPDAIAIFTNQKKSSGAAFETERPLAKAIIDDLAAGKVDRLHENMLDWIPRSWPETVKSKLWSKRVADLGAMKTCEEIGASEEKSLGRVRAWVRCRHERGDATVELAFAMGRLYILDLNGCEFPASIIYMPSGPRSFVNYDFGRTPAPPIELLIRPLAGGKAAFKKLI